jgi:hypothetical protein
MAKEIKFNGRTIWIDYVFTNPETGIEYKITWEKDKAHGKGVYIIHMYRCDERHDHDWNQKGHFELSGTNPTVRKSWQLIQKYYNDFEAGT